MKIKLKSPPPAVSLRRKIGFTLIELLVVVLIIGILAAIAIPQYKKAVERAHMAEMQIKIDAISKSLQRYYMENSAFPLSFNDLDIILPGVVSGDGEGATHALTYGDMRYFITTMGTMGPNIQTSGSPCVWARWDRGGSFTYDNYLLGRGPAGQELCAASVDRPEQLKKCESMGFTVAATDKGMLWPQCAPSTALAYTTTFLKP